MHRSSLALSSCLAILALSACGAEPASTGTEPPAADPVEAPAGDAVSMRYRCEGGYAIAIIGDLARVTTEDGRQIELRRVTDRSPPLFAGEALELSIESGGAVLGQDEGTPRTCQEAD